MPNGSQVVQYPPMRSAPMRLKKRADFLKAAKGQRLHAKCFSLQDGLRSDEPSSLNEAPRFGLTVTKKVGHAVERSRIRRRLKEALRHAPNLPAQSGHDYVIVARTDVLTAPFTYLMSELGRTLGQLASGKRYTSQGRRSSGASHVQRQPDISSSNERPGSTS